MDGTKALYYGAVALAILIGVSVVLSVISAIVGLVGAVVSGIVSLAVLAGVAYVAYAVGSWLFGGSDAPVETDSIGDSWSTSSASSGDAPESRQDRLRRKYVEGQISEEEFERRIASELETEEPDDVDRKVADIEQELERER